jgi:hypothetical protein
VSLNGVLLNCQVAEVLSQVGVGVGLVLNVFSAGVKAILSFFDVDIEGSNLSTKVDVSSFSGLNMLANIVAISGNSINILSQGRDLNNLLGVKVLDSGNFSLGVIKLD